MRLHREGFTIILITTLVLGAINVPLQIYLSESVISTIVLAISLLLYVAIVQFFRHPNRNIPTGENLIIAPADGKVVVIEEVVETEYYKDKRRQVSIFMSPINVHVNRYPVSGKVAYQKYHPGKYLVAWHPKSSTENERTTVVVESSKGSILFRQIAGALAKRIVCYAKEGAEAKIGAEYGFIKFGSRIDLFLPLDAEICVEMNQKTVGGETIVAKW